MALLDRFNKMGLLVKDSFQIELGWGVDIDVEDHGDGEFCIEFPLTFFNNFTKVIPMLKKVDGRLGSLEGYEIDLPEDFEEKLPFINLKRKSEDDAEDIIDKIEFPGPDTFYLTKMSNEMRIAPLTVGEETPIGACTLMVDNEIMPGQSEDGDVGVYCYKSVCITVGQKKESDDPSEETLNQLEEVTTQIQKEIKKNRKKNKNKKK